MRPSTKLPNHLLRFRKRSSLSQADVAFLLGCRSGTKVCRHERFVRQPDLRAAFAYEAIFQTAASALFPGVYREVEQEVVRRTRLLAARISKATPCRSATRKLETIQKILPSAVKP